MEQYGQDPATRIQGLFNESAELKQRMGEELAPSIVEAAKLIRETLLGGNKVLACGNGGSAGDAQHFVGELVNRFEIERPPLPAIALGTNPVTVTAAANDYSFEEIYAKEVQALGQSGDLLLVISTSGQSANVLQAAEAAFQRGLRLLVLTGADGGELADLARPGEDLVLRVDSRTTARIQEVHILILHGLCMLVDQELFGSG
ncbi:D-sedoheptulose-7-phosphate isomerase [Thiohalorhabdus sp. Cl-TMA]|uniref:Phosphoheptose isomerase n=1 Tax=Thiohalorhabdus methylotrophus TaxID=3242694 RepID=A0ABV4TRM5_9GAMM